jgi:hypothetical protein
MRGFVLSWRSTFCAYSIDICQSLRTRFRCHDDRYSPTSLNSSSDVLAEDSHDWISDLLIGPMASSLDLSLANVAFRDSLDESESKSVLGRGNYYYYLNTTAMDPFEVRMQFLALLRRLNALSTPFLLHRPHPDGVLAQVPAINSKSGWLRR